MAMLFRALSSPNSLKSLPAAALGLNMGVDSRTAKSARARRFLKNREAKVTENPKTALLVRGQKTSGLINDALTDLFMLKKPHGALY